MAACSNPFPRYLPHSREGLNLATTLGDGYTVGLDWINAFPDISSYKVIYNIYYSTLVTDVFTEGVKTVSTLNDYTAAYILELTPGDVFYFAVRATEYDPNWYDPSLLPDGFPNLKVYPEAILLSQISDSTIEIPVSDIDQFPNQGIIQIGQELIRYLAKDLPSNSLLAGERGFLGSTVSLHQPDGYDGTIIQDPIVRFWKGFEESNTVIHQATSKFAYPNFPRTIAEGYKTITRDNLNTELSGSETIDGVPPVAQSDAAQGGFPTYDYSGYHRTDPISLLNGLCIGTYYGGEIFCADGYEVGFQLRGLSLSDANSQRQEELLELTGEPVVLVQRQYTGVVCSCIQSTTTNPSLRCPYCYGSGFVTGYQQFFNPRRSDGRILIRFSPSDDDVRIEDEGLESVLLPDCWTLVIPALKSRDFIIRFNVDGTEEFRYEILSVNRNKLLSSLSGGQKFKAQRIRRTDPIYQFKTFRDSSTMPAKITTGIGMAPGLLPHVHEVVISEGIVSLAQINQTTSINQGHNHVVTNGVVGQILEHTHTLIL